MVSKHIFNFIKFKEAYIYLVKDKLLSGVANKNFTENAHLHWSSKLWWELDNQVLRKCILYFYDCGKNINQPKKTIMKARKFGNELKTNGKSKESLDKYNSLTCY